VIEAGKGETSQIAQHIEDMLVDRVDMEQIMLHLPDDAAEGRNIAAEDAVTVHQTQGVGDTDRLLQNPDEQRLVSG